MAILPKLIYRVNVISFKIPTGFFAEIDELVLKFTWGTPLVAQWLRIHLPLQGTRVRALVWGDPTCRGATKPMSHNY